MMTMRFLVAGLIAVSVCAAGCSKDASEGHDAGDGAGEYDGLDHDAAGHDEGAGRDTDGPDTEAEGETEMTKDAKAEAFAALITKALMEGDTDTIVGRMKGVNLPEGWREMIVPMLNGMVDYELTGVVRPRSEFSNEDLKWPEETPEALKAVEHILYVSYETEESSGNRSFPLVYEDDAWWILLAQ